MKDFTRSNSAYSIAHMNKTLDAKADDVELNGPG